MISSNLALLVAASFAAGIINSVAGGGLFLTFPALVFVGIPSVAANATGSVAVFPGQLASAWGYRHDFPSIKGLKTRMVILISIAGGIAGSLLLIYTPEKAFNSLIPWLLLFATLAFAFSSKIVPQLKRYISLNTGSLCISLFLLSVYGGYFGGGAAIIMLAIFSFYGIDHINTANALKTLLMGLCNASAVVIFIAAKLVAWGPALIMLVASVVGGYLGARVARKMNPSHVRWVVITIGSVMTVIFMRRA